MRGWTGQVKLHHSRWHVSAGKSAEPRQGGSPTLQPDCRTLAYRCSGSSWRGCACCSAAPCCDQHDSRLSSCCHRSRARGRGQRLGPRSSQTGTPGWGQNAAAQRSHAVSSALHAGDLLSTCLQKLPPGYRSRLSQASPVRHATASRSAALCATSQPLSLSNPPTYR
jgi:hypothetical protein